MQVALLGKDDYRVATHYWKELGRTPWYCYRYNNWNFRVVVCL